MLDIALRDRKASWRTFLDRRFRRIVEETRSDHADLLSRQGVVEVAETTRRTFSLFGEIRVSNARGTERTVSVGLLRSRYRIAFALLLAAQNLWLLDVIRHGTTEEIRQALHGPSDGATPGPDGHARRPVPRLVAASPCWGVLGVPAGSSAEDVRSAWVGLARRHHPDAGGDAGRMAVVNAARDEALALLSA